MKHLVETININEARNLEYRVSFTNLTDAEYLPITVTITLDDRDSVKPFEAYLRKELDNTIFHAEGGPNTIEL
jgi:hypothetical protein